MKGILKRLYIKDKIYILSIIFFIILFFSSILYYYITQKIVYILIPLPNKTYIKLGFSGYELLLMTLNGVLNDQNVKKDLNNYTYVNKKVIELNDIILNNKRYYYYYYFYQIQFDKLYPTKYFILCYGDSCNSFFLSYAGIIIVNSSLINTSKYMVVYVNPSYFDNILYILKENKTEDLLSYFKYGLEYGYIRISNDKLLVQNILKYYNFTYV